MENAVDLSAQRAEAEALVEEFWGQVWNPPHDVSVVDHLVTEDFVITTAGQDVVGRDAFKAWIVAFHDKAHDIRLTSSETFANTDASRVVSRWRACARNNGMLGTSPDGREVEFTGIAIWAIHWTDAGPRLAHNWVERSAWELFQQLT